MMVPAKIGRPFVVVIAYAAASLAYGRAWSAARCDGAEPWVLVELRADGWTDAQRRNVLGDLQNTLAPQGIGACAGATHPPGQPLATLAIELPPTGKAMVDIEVRDAVTKKRVRREVDLTSIPADGRELAIAIETDELLRACWAEIALDTERSRVAERRGAVAGSVAEVLTPARVQNAGSFGARAAGETFLGGATLVGADTFGHLHLGGRAGIELAAEIRASPPVATAHGRVGALAAGGGISVLFRLAGGNAASIDVGVGIAGSWLQFRGEPSSGSRSSAYDNLLLVSRARVLGRLALGRWMHAALGVQAGETLVGVAARDSGQVVRSASGLALGATLGLETP
ncbi:MAG: hypothetical protein ABIS92_14405 [Polyangia bacterium]